jgi:hypothetical protein
VTESLTFDIAFFAIAFLAILAGTSLDRDTAAW